VRALWGASNPSKFGAPGGISDSAWREARASLEAMGFAGETCTPEVRLMLAHDGAVWIDLGDPSWRLVRVDPSG
jgi:hypothetical protein